MTKKIERERNSHDRKVREIARQYKRDGYTVKVDGVRGYHKPRAIGSEGYIPDIVAVKSGKTIIVEVKTAKSITRDKEQLKAFAMSAAHRSRTELHLVVTNPRKRQPTSRPSIRGH